MWVAIRVFNNRNFIATKKSFYVTETSSVRKMSVPFLTINIVVLFFFFFFKLAVSFHQRYRQNRFKSFVLPLFVTVFCFYDTWLYIPLVNFSDDVEENPGQHNIS